MPHKFKTTIRGIDAVQAVYALIIALGIREVFLTAYRFVTRNLEWSLTSGEPSNPLVTLLLFSNVFFVGVRFFWVPRNIRTTIVTYQRAEVAGTGGGAAISDRLIATSLIIIFIHAAVFYAMCSEFEFFVFSRSAPSGFQSTVLEGYVLLHVSLLVINAAWITSLTRLERKVRAAASPHDGVIWARNNLAFGVLAAGPLVLFGPCKSAAVSCLGGYGEVAAWVHLFLPTSPESSSFLVWLIKQIPNISHDLAVSVLVLSFLLCNSLVDLFSTGRHYIFLEEWENEEPIVPQAPNP